VGDICVLRDPHRTGFELDFTPFNYYLLATRLGGTIPSSPAIKIEFDLSATAIEELL
jgi:hypothetical protein